MGKKGDVPGRGQALSGIGFLHTGMESGFVPVGAGEVGMWRGDPCGLAVCQMGAFLSSFSPFGLSEMY